jgi:hypothetical protein
MIYFDEEPWPSLLLILTFGVFAAEFVAVML